jgi:hypothetical protein
MGDSVSRKTYNQVMEKYGWKCQFPGCNKRNIEYSHIVFRSHDKSLIDNPGNGIPLCPEHHRTGKNAVHRSRWWRYWYIQFLPDEIKEKLSKYEKEYTEKNVCNT